jgi:DNA processing protein
MNATETHKLLHIALTKIPNIGAVTARTLIGYCGSIDEVFAANKKTLLAIPNIGETSAAKFLDNKDEAIKLAEKEVKYCASNDIQILIFSDKNYPQKLRNYESSPLVLYYAGNADLNHPRMVSIIGTRKPTPQGEAICEQIIQGLTKYKPMIISGLAYGIDITAHRNALKYGLETVGVMGTGMTKIYPIQHLKTANEMRFQGGLLTEFGHDVKLNPDLFPARNRIIAALADALVVVESAITGGSMITAQMAFDFNKDIFAVPGRLNDKYSQGCNNLIRINKANLIETADDIAYHTRWNEIDMTKNVQSQLFIDLSPEEEIMLNLIKDNAEISIDALFYKANLTPSESASLLLNLEFKGVIKALPGKRYVVIK